PILSPMADKTLRTETGFFLSAPMPAECGIPHGVDSASRRRRCKPQLIFCLFLVFALTPGRAAGEVKLYPARVMGLEGNLQSPNRVGVGTSLGFSRDIGSRFALGLRAGLY
ncbi:MAG: hypothetical protein LBP32_09255, partial [Spirochaetaceae bacterium]|nr:hypothetical protein [Spirochaetaceae bacterium]